MSFFSRKPREINITRDSCNSSKKTIEKIKQWENQHFYNNSYFSRSSANTAFSKFITENRYIINLANIKAPAEKTDSSDSIFRKLFNQVSRQPLNVVYAKYRGRVRNEILRYKDNVAKLQKLDRDIQVDSLFPEIDDIFNNRLKMLYNELVLCRFEQLADAAYFGRMKGRVTRITEDLNALNSAFSDYMYALTDISNNVSSDSVEAIRIKVQGMASAAEKVSDKI